MVRGGADPSVEETPFTSTTPDVPRDTVNESVVYTAPGVRVVEPTTRLELSPTAVTLGPSVNVCPPFTVVGAVGGDDGDDNVVVVPSTIRSPEGARDAVNVPSV